MWQGQQVLLLLELLWDRLSLREQLLSLDFKRVVWQQEAWLQVGCPLLVYIYIYNYIYVISTFVFYSNFSVLTIILVCSTVWIKQIY